jgi:glutamyl-tRNA synthetase
MITRLAPTPSGYLHQGNAFNFLLNWLMARAQGGQVLLRIDDLDAPRAKPEYVQDVFETLDWLGMDWDMGPTGPDDLATHWSQQHRHAIYHEVLQQLMLAGQLFACDCSRKDLAKSGGVYPGTCSQKHLLFNTPDVAWRVRVGAGETIHFTDNWQGKLTVAVGADMGSFVVRRRDGIPAYQIASLADDVRFGITHVARGMDLLPSTAAQLYLAQLLGMETFTQTQFYHHPLLLGEGGTKLSKSAGSVSLHYARQQGMPASEVLGAFCKWAGITPNQPFTKAADLVHYWPNLKV